jgi:hypothetical protein
MADWVRELTFLRNSGIQVAPGLSETQLQEAERHHTFRFPQDLREFLSVSFPTGRDFPDWRSPAGNELRDRLASPLQGLLFDIEHNQFWWAGWGDRPRILDEALAVARSRFASLPRLVPIFSHRFIPADPSEAGNPVFSVYQTDVTYYGSDLSTYLEREFAGGRLHSDETPRPHRRIPFWSDLAEDETL